MALETLAQGAMILSTLPHENEKNGETREMLGMGWLIARVYTFKTLSNELTTRGFHQEINLMGFYMKLSIVHHRGKNPAL